MSDEYKAEIRRTFIGLIPFETAWKALGLTDQDRRGLELALLENPKAGVLLKETNGIRKVRRPRMGPGKSGGIRVFYYDYEMLGRIYLMAVIKKGDQENLTKAERNVLHNLIATIKKGQK
jgi:hypothetical protein